MSDTSTLLLYSQPLPATSAFILGDRASLKRARDLISAALQASDGSAMTQFAERGREEYSLVVAVVSDQELSTLRAPFTAAEFAARRKGIDPMDVESVQVLFPPER